MSQTNLRVLVVDDTALYRKVITDLLKDAPGVEVVGTAPNGRIALQKCEQLKPDLLTLDLEMPEVDGLDVLRKLKADKRPIGAIMLSAFTTNGADATMAALKLGAFDFVVKPTGASATASIAALRSDLLPKIETFARSRRIRSILRGPSGEPRPAALPRLPASTSGSARSVARPRAGKPGVVAIGISTGGPQALSVMLPKLPADLATPVLIVQHMPPLFTRSLARGLNEKCSLSVREAADGDAVCAGEILIAPGGRQMKVERDQENTVVRITDDPPENSCRPAVDYLFRSVAQVYGANALGVVMTGMGSDGTVGCRLLKGNGAAVLTQDETSCVVYGMPRAPAEEGLSDVVAPLDRIADEIVRLVGRKKLAVCK